MAVENWIDNIVTTNTRPASLVRAKIFVYGGFGGRFDQEMACINALYAWGMKEKFRCTSMALYGEETCAFLLSAAPAVNEIRIMFPEDGNCTRKKSNGQLIGEGPSCGLIPLGNRCNDVITTGLKWNLNGDIPLEFGGLVSSSNRIMNEVVTVRTSAPMIFTTEMLNKS
jgi:thiamine pyrophosphokinase